MKKILVAAVASLSMVGSVAAQDSSADKITAQDLGNGIYMLEGPGGNIGVSVGEDGVFVIDDKFAPLTDKILAAIGAVTDKRVDYVINTHWHGDHTGGNENFGKAGSVIIAHDNVRVRMVDAERGGEDGKALPVITFSDTTTFHYNGNEIHAFHPGNAHTDGDAIIHFRNLNLIHSGDIVFNGMYPYIDGGSGGAFDGYITALETLAAMSDDETVIIPGHGPMSSKADIEASIVMLKDVKGRILKLIADGVSMEEAIAAKPLADLHDDWSWGFITSDRFVELSYGLLQ